MHSENELKINARGLSPPGPRLMVENALREQKVNALRVVVTNQHAVDDLKDFFDLLGVSIIVDEVAAEFHVLADFTERRERGR